MSTVYKMEHDGEIKTFAEWGITNPVLQLINQGIDTLTFSMPSVLFDDEFAFEYRDTLIFTRDDGDGDERFFYGVVTKRTRAGNASGEEWHSFVVSGPDWHLSRIPFSQDWKFLKTGAEFPLTEDSYDTIPISVLLLNANNAGARVGTKLQLKAIMDYAISLSVPMAYDSALFPNVDAPIDEVRDMMIFECISRELRWVPDAVRWWDYSTSPYPTLHIAPRFTFDVNTLAQTLALESATINATDGTRVESVEIDSLDDLRLDGVIITYQTSTEVNGSKLNTREIMKAPDSSVTPGPQVLQVTINLEGTAVSYAESTIVTQAVDATSLAWWKARQPWMNKTTNIKDLAILTSPVPTRESALANEITAGEYSSWMGGTCEADTIEASFSFTVCDDAGNEIKKVTSQPYSHRCNVTNLASGTRRSLTDYTPGEPVPTNLHSYLYNAARTLHYAGSVVLTDEECPSDISVGQVLNITGSLAEWESMNAVIQSVTKDLDGRRTTIQVGAPQHLGYSDLIEWMRATRFRMRYTPTTARSTAQGGTNGAIQLGEKTAKENTQNQHAAYDRMVLGGTVAATAGTPAADGFSSVGLIDINKDHVNGKPIKFRELTYCDNGTEKKILVLCSELYT